MILDYLAGAYCTIDLGASRAIWMQLLLGKYNNAWNPESDDEAHLHFHDYEGVFGKNV